MIDYRTSAEGITPAQLHGFFVGWPNPPSPATHLRALTNSDVVVLAVDDQTANVVGFITAISDGVLCAFIPLLEVLPAYQHQGIGHELIGRMLARLQHLYAVDLICDADLQPFYAQFGLKPWTAMLLRNNAALTAVQ
jgi:GNAT superfamily N-acetyltransferase